MSPSHPAPNFEPTPAEQVFAAYSWSLDRPCYRCGRDDVETATVGAVSPDPDEAIDVPACPSCVLALERDREAAARRYGWPYKAGTPAEDRCG